MQVDDAANGVDFGRDAKADDKDDEPVGGIALRLVGELKKAIESVVPKGAEINRDANETDDDRVPDVATLPRVPGDQPANGAKTSIVARALKLSPRCK